MTAAQQELINYLATRSQHKPASTLPGYLNPGRMVQVALILTVCLAAGLAFAGLFNGKGQGYTVDPGDMAATMAERFVSQHLHCPSTAQFSPSPAIKRDGDGFRVTSYVDAENKFGATVRSHWTATVEDYGGQWRLLNLEWNNQ